MKLVDKIIKPVADTPLQAYLDNRIQLFDIIEKILNDVGTAEIYISTFSTSEEFLRRIYKLRTKGLISRAAMLIDLKASRKIVNLHEFISNVFDDVYLAENHSKVILIRNEKWMVSICTSQNQTRGNRTESGMITTIPTIYLDLLERFNHIVNNNSLKLDGLLKGTDRKD